MAELPIAPGQVYIEVEYDYEYKAKDRLITIRQGECYMLVKKTNEDWWQVKKEEGAKAFYVPAQYVREVRKALMPPSKQIPHPPTTASNTSSQGAGARWVKPTNLELGLNNRPAENLHRNDSSYQRSHSSQTGLSGNKDNNHHHAPASPTEHDRGLAEILAHGGVLLPPYKGGSLPRTRARSPELVREPLDVDSTQHCDSAGEERRTNDSESGDELSSSSTEHLQTVSSSGQGRSESPVYTNLQELKITQTSQPPLPSGSPLHVHGDWETYKDQNGRHFYYNRSTQERTWKPPRTRDTSIRKYQGESHSTGESSEPSEKCGVLNVTKITENGKKVRKNWTSSWTVLQGSTLLFSKQQGGGTSWFGGGQSKPEFTVDLRGGSVECASKDKSSKKNVLELKTRQGTELLIQSENDSIVNDWLRALQDAISNHAWESDEAIEEDMPESPVEKHDKEKEHRESKKGRGLCAVKWY